jgi:tetratricopeptide (TPR) repeat protein
LLERAFLFLEDGNWDEADAYCERVLDQEPKNAEAYLGKLMAELHARSQEDLSNLDQPFEKNNNYQKILRFGDEPLIRTVKGYVESINKRFEQAHQAALDAKYKSAIALFNDGKYMDAIAVLEELNGYKDSLELITMYKDEQSKEVRVGSVVAFGPFEWIVLAKNDSNMMLISKDAVTNKKSYNSQHARVTWETCTLRTWLNEDFLYNFSSEEQAKILTTTVINPNNPDRGTVGGNTTFDKVFLLSIDEAKSLFSSNAVRVCHYQGSVCWWWLRTPGVSSDRAAYVNPDGYVHACGLGVDSGSNCVRPALWVNLRS